MNVREAYEWVLSPVTVIIVICGTVRSIIPELIAPVLSAKCTTGRHFFGIVGIPSGSMFWHPLGQPHMPVIWAGGLMGWLTEVSDAGCRAWGKDSR